MTVSVLPSMKSIHELWAYFDTLVEQDNDDVLFVSSYLRGFIEVAAIEYGGEEQALSMSLYQKVNAQLEQSKAELSAIDAQLVHNFWTQLKVYFQ